MTSRPSASVLLLAESVAPSATILAPALKLRVPTKQPLTRTRLQSFDSGRGWDSCTRAGDLTGQDLLQLELPSRLAMVRLLSAPTGDDEVGVILGAYGCRQGAAQFSAGVCLATSLACGTTSSRLRLLHQTTPIRSARSWGYVQETKTSPAARPSSYVGSRVSPQASACSPRPRRCARFQFALPPDCWNTLPPAGNPNTKHPPYMPSAAGPHVQGKRIPSARTFFYLRCHVCQH